MENSTGVLKEACMFVSDIPPNVSGCPVLGACDPASGLHLVSPSNNRPCNSSLNGCPPAEHKGYNTTVLYKYRRCITTEEEISTSSLLITSESPPVSVSKNSLLAIGITIGILIAITMGVISLLAIRWKRNKKRSTKTKVPKEETFEQEEKSLVNAVEEGKAVIITDDDSLQVQLNKKTSHELEAWVPKDIIQQDNIPLEIIRYLKLEGITCKRLVDRIEVPMFHLLTKAPDAIQIVGQLHFLAWQFCSQFEEEDETARELLCSMTQLANNCKGCFRESESNVDKIKHQLTRIMQLIEELSQLLERISNNENVRILLPRCQSLRDCIRKCEELANENQRKFQEMDPPKAKINLLLRNAESKIHTKIKSRTLQMERGIADWPNLHVTDFSKLASSSDPGSFREACKREAKFKKENDEKIEQLRKLQQSFKDAVCLSNDLCDHWNSLASFFQKLGSVIEIYLTNDVKIMSETLSPESKISEGVSIDSDGVGDLGIAIEINSKTITDNAAYAKVISQLYVHVSQSIFTECFSSLQAPEKFDASERKEIEEKNECLKSICDKQKENIVHLCQDIALLKAAISKSLFAENQ